MCTYWKMPSLTCVYILYNKNNQKCLLPKCPVLNVYIPSKQHNHKHKVLLPKLLALHFYIPYTTTQIEKQRLVSKILSLTCVHTLYRNTNIHTKDHCESSQSDMCTYSLPKTIIRLVAKIPNITCVHTLYNNTNINIKACWKHSRYYMCIYHL